MNKFDATALAARLGITRDVFPELFGKHCTTCDRRWGISVAACPKCHTAASIKEACYLPDPASDDPRAVLWEPFLMQALDWPRINSFPATYPEEPNCLTYNGLPYAGPTPTAALYAALEAKDAAND
jgi:hypothetical protein